MESPVDPSDNKFKLIFVMYNLVLWTSGLVLVWFGVWLEVELTRYIKLDTQAVSFLLLSTGSLMVLFNSISCFCVLKGISSSLLSVYGLVLGVLFVMDIIMSVCLLWLKEQLQLKLGAHRLNVQDSSIDMNLIQSSLKCCGLKGGVADWTSLDLSVPVSCCSSADNCNVMAAVGLWPEGCYSQMGVFIDDNIGIMSLLVLVFAAVTLFGVFCSFSWAKKYSPEYEILE